MLEKLPEFCEAGLVMQHSVRLEKAEEQEEMAALAAAAAPQRQQHQHLRSSGARGQTGVQMHLPYGKATIAQV
jgi:hypothetical protein